TQETGGLFTVSAVITDNDASRSAETTVREFAAASPLPVRYCVETRQNVPLARNRALESASGDYIAFLDDDEFPAPRWLLTLFETCNRSGVAGVLGPVKPYFDEKTPKWVVKGKFYDRPVFPTGLPLQWNKGRTGNVLFKKEILPQDEPPFRSQFRGGGADQDFFRRMIENGHTFIWCDDAVAYEYVPPVRWKRSFMLRKALLRGGVTPLHPSFGFRDVVKSLIAVPLYSLAMPFALLIGHERFMALMIKVCDHLGRLLACMGIKPIKAAYVTE
ncbi:MAG: glycosyltransferase family 2 protein, partial [Terriglobia bacterium]